MMQCWIVGKTYWPKTDPFAPFLTSIGEQEQLKKLSDNFGLSKQNKINCIWSGIVDSDWKGKKVKDNFYLQSIIV